MTEEIITVETDPILESLRYARSLALSDMSKSRELSLVVTKIDEAILWRQFDLQIKESQDQH